VNTTRISSAVGLFLFGLAVLVLADVIAFDVTSAYLIGAVGVIALLAAVNGFTRRREERTVTETPDPERRATVPVPGHTLSSAINQFRRDSYEFTTGSQRISEGLTGAAMAVLTRFEGLSKREARTQLKDGTWTEDEYAAAFLSPDLEVEEKPLRDRLAGVLDLETSFRQYVRRTAAAIATIGYGGLGERRAPEEIPQYDPEDFENIEPRTTTKAVTEPTEYRNTQTGYWTGVGALALTAIGFGALAEAPGVVLAGVVGVGYAGFAHLLEAPEPEISLERVLSEEDPEPDEEVTVTVRVSNESGRLLPDVRILDGVPPGLSVTDGVARLGTSLRPGDSVQFSYTVTARRGTHEFDPAIVLTRDFAQSNERTFHVPAKTTLVARPTLRPLATSVPLQPAAAGFSGQLTTADAGEGMQFHSVREYRRNDPLNRIDWNRHARSGELATLEFHEERAARVLILIDARKSAYLAPEPDAPHAIDRSVEAAGRIATSLLDAGDTVGLAALGPVDRQDSRRINLKDTCWLGPSSGHHHRMQLSELLASHPQFSTEPPSAGTQWQAQLRMVRRRLGSETQVVFLTPLCDGGSVRTVRRLNARGHALTVITPDTTAERTTSQQLARVGRRIRRFDLQRAGIPVIDWPADDTIDEAIARAHARGRR